MTDPSSEQALARLARISLAEHTLQTVAQTVAEVTAQVVPGADAVSVTLVERGRPRTVASTEPLALELDEHQYALGSGPCVDAVAGGEVLEVADTATDTRWAAWATRAAERGARASLSVPLPLQREVAAALNVYRRRTGPFDDDARAAARSVAAHAAVALANVHLYESQGRTAEQLQTAMQSRAVIEQAKGVLMAQRGLDPEQAFTLLVALSQRSNRKLREVAQALVDAVATGGSPPADGRTTGE